MPPIHDTRLPSGVTSVMSTSSPPSQCASTVRSCLTGLVETGSASAFSVVARVASSASRRARAWRRHRGRARAGSAPPRRRPCRPWARAPTARCDGCTPAACGRRLVRVGHALVGRRAIRDRGRRCPRACAARGRACRRGRAGRPDSRAPAGRGVSRSSHFARRRSRGRARRHTRAPGRARGASRGCRGLGERLLGIAIALVIVGADASYTASDGTLTHVRRIANRLGFS